MSVDLSTDTENYGESLAFAALLQRTNVEENEFELCIITLHAHKIYR
jgi:hypothetical protein